MGNTCFISRFVMTFNVFYDIIEKFIILKLYFTVMYRVLIKNIQAK